MPCINKDDWNLDVYICFLIKGMHMQGVEWIVASPYLCQHRLGEAGQHEDLYDLGAIHQAVTVGVCLYEEFIVAFLVGNRYHPIHCRLEGVKTKQQISEKNTTIVVV